MKKLYPFAGTNSSQEHVSGRSSKLRVSNPAHHAEARLTFKRTFLSAAALVTLFAAGASLSSAQEIVSFNNVQWSGPITINQGGTYSGNWRSTNAGQPAVTINTSAPVTIQNSNIEGPADLIQDLVNGSDITVKNTQGLGLNPNVAGSANGIFLSTYNPGRVDVENNTMENVRFGVWIRGFVGSPDGYHTVVVKANRARNMTGLRSNGSGGYEFTDGNNFEWSHFVQLGDVHGIPGIEISWNEVVNEPYKSFCEEVINMYRASGTSSSPAQIHDNFIQGAFPYDPATQSYNGGGFVTDGDSTDNDSTATAFNLFHDNQIVGVDNQGASIGHGHDNQIYNNRVISSGLLSNGSHVIAANVGLSMSNAYGSGGPFYNNDIHGNTVGWMCWKSGCSWDGYRNDQWYGVSTNDWNTNKPLAGGAIPYSAEGAELAIWQAKLAGSGVKVGTGGSSSPSSPSTPTSGGGSTTISSSAWYNVINTNSHLCVDMRAQSTADGTAVQQESCGNSQYFQEWQLAPTDSGYYRIYPRTAGSEVWDVAGGPAATGSSVPVQTWTNKGNSNQQWMPVPLGNGYFKFVARNSSKCLDVPNASTQSGLQLQQYTCNGTGAQSFQLVQK